jgi:5-methylcytosine-specific restriction endonuclease McrA
MSYAELLRDPRWQRRRLEIMNRAGFACERCHSKSTTLNVHHVHYIRGRKPWEYDDSELRCLCEPCHKATHGIRPVASRPTRKLSPEETALREKIADVDRRLVAAEPEDKDAIILEKRDLFIRLTEFTKHMWVGS